MAKWGIVPVTWPQYDWNYARAPFFMPLERPRHFYIVAVVGRQEIGANQKKDDLGRLNVLIDKVMNILAGLYPSVVPFLNSSSR